MSGRLIDLTGKRFGRLVVLRRDGYVIRTSKQPTWLCICDCGEECVVVGADLRGGNTKSCGCLRDAYLKSGAVNRTHGKSRTPTYRSWRAMKERCDNPSNSHYQTYGGKGVSYDPAWATFEEFLSDMGERPIGTTLDRVDCTLGYYVNNCRWATAKEQARNTSRTKKVTWGGETKCVADWAADIGISKEALAYRLKRFGVQVAMTMRKFSLPNGRKK